MQRDCRDGHPLSCVARMAVRWCPRCARFEVRVWAAEDKEGGRLDLIPEWSDVVRLEDDEWCARTLTKYVTGMARTVQTLENDADAGIMRLL